jgi:hypothetical protein
MVVRIKGRSSLIAIHKQRFLKLVTALRIAVANKYELDKEQTSVKPDAGILCEFVFIRRFLIQSPIRKEMLMIFHKSV